MGGGWEQFTPALEDLPLKGDTVAGNDVWLGQNVTVMQGVNIGDEMCIRDRCRQANPTGKRSARRFQRLRKILV